MSELENQIKEIRKSQGGEILTLKAGQMEIVKFDLDEKGHVVGKVFDREYKPTGKKSKAVMFQVTMVNTGERKNFPLALSWAEALIEKVQRKNQPVVEITRRGTAANDTSYDFQTVS